MTDPSSSESQTSSLAQTVISGVIEEHTTTVTATVASGQSRAVFKLKNVVIACILGIVMEFVL